MEEQTKSDLKTISDVMQITQIALDNYDDIFSDFDPSPYGTRLLSEDFLRELSRRYSQKKKGEFIVNFTIPANERSEKTESLIKKRFKDYFKQELKNLEKIQKDKRFDGMIRILVGILLSALLITVPELDTTPILTIFSVLLWYVLWSGFELIFDASREFKRKLVFTENFMKAKYNFVTEEQIITTIQKLQDIQAVTKKELPLKQTIQNAKQEQLSKPDQPDAKIPTQKDVKST
ncbi:MAG: hypothetical protein ABID61_01830 [Candidatus Micrarchaeota archaeon]